jgi:hypothetical protein
MNITHTNDAEWLLHTSTKIGWRGMPLDYPVHVGPPQKKSQKGVENELIRASM